MVGRCCIGRLVRRRADRKRVREPLLRLRLSRVYGYGYGYPAYGYGYGYPAYYGYAYSYPRYYSYYPRRAYAYVRRPYHRRWIRY